MKSILSSPILASLIGQLIAYVTREIFDPNEASRNMGSDDLKLMFELHSKGYKDALEIFVAEQNKKIDLMEQRFRSAENKMRKEVEELQRSLEFSQKDIEDHKQRLLDLEKENETKDTKIKDLEAEIVELNEKHNYLEDASRRQNVRIFGIPENPEGVPPETWEQTAEKVQDLLKKELGIEDAPLDRAHRVGELKDRHRQPRAIVARFQRYADRDNTLRNAHKLANYRTTDDKKVSIREDLCKASLQKRKDKMSDLIQAKKDNKIAYFSHTKLITKERPPPRNGQPAPSSFSEAVSGARDGSTEADASSAQHPEAAGTSGQQREDAATGGGGSGAYRKDAGAKYTDRALRPRN